MQSMLPMQSMQTLTVDPQNQQKQLVNSPSATTSSSSITPNSSPYQLPMANAVSAVTNLDAQGIYENVQQIEENLCGFVDDEVPVMADHHWLNEEVFGDDSTVG